MLRLPLLLTIMTLIFALSAAPTAQAWCVDLEPYEDSDQDPAAAGLITDNGVGAYTCSNGDCSAVAVRANCDLLRP